MGVYGEYDDDPTVGSRDPQVWTRAFFEERWDRVDHELMAGWFDRALGAGEYFGKTEERSQPVDLGRVSNRVLLETVRDRAREWSGDAVGQLKRNLNIQLNYLAIRDPAFLQYWPSSQFTTGQTLVTSLDNATGASPAEKFGPHPQTGAMPIGEEGGEPVYATAADAGAPPRWKIPVDTDPDMKPGEVYLIDDNRVVHIDGGPEQGDKGPPPIRDTDLIGQTDARVWAEAFCERFTVVTRGRRGVDDDQVGIMISWFANAMESGRSAEIARHAMQSSVNTSPRDDELMSRLRNRLEGELAKPNTDPALVATLLAHLR